MEVDSLAICVTRRIDGRILVRADNPDQVTVLDNTYYFHPDTVDLDGLEKTSRVYQCPHKGTCCWIDLVTEKGVIIDASWIYPEPKKGYRHIAGWYGFYANHRYYETKECD